MKKSTMPPVCVLFLVGACQLETSVAAFDFSSQLPVVILEESTFVLTNRGHHPSKVTVLAPKDGWVSFSNGIVAYCGSADVWLRGNSSRFLPKKSYRLELHNDSGEEVKAPLLGMPAESDWILLAAFPDKTLVRDALAHELWAALGYYSPRTRFVELLTRRPETNAMASPSQVNAPNQAVLNGAELQNREQPPSLNSTNRKSARAPAPVTSVPMFFCDYEYQGIYLLVEKIKRGKQRLNIQKLRKEDQDEPDITGGYIFKRDRLDADERGFRTPQKAFFAFDEPKERNLTPAQAAWLTNYVAEFEHALFSEQFTDTTNGYARHIDVDSFIDYHWMTEVSRNLDGYWVSQYYHKDRGEKLKMGPIWDFDLAFGNAGNHGCHRTNGWHWEALRGNEYEWFARLFEDADFLQRYIDRWAELRSTIFATSNVLARIDRLTGELKEAQARNFQRWPILGKRIHISKYVGATYQDEVDWMKNWMAGRLAWIDSQDFPAPAMHVAKNRLSGTNEIRLACLVGKIYFTTNGTDPRLSGGSPSPDAFEYRSPIQLPCETPFTARVRSDDGLWSAPVRFDVTPEGNQTTATKDAQREHTNFAMPLALDPRSKASSPISSFLFRVVARPCLSLHVGA